MARGEATGLHHREELHGAIWPAQVQRSSNAYCLRVVEHDLEDRRLNSLPIGIAVDTEGTENKPCYYEEYEEEDPKERCCKHTGRLALATLVVTPAGIAGGTC